MSSRREHKNDGKDANTKKEDRHDVTATSNHHIYQKLGFDVSNVTIRTGNQDIKSHIIESARVEQSIASVTDKHPKVLIIGNSDQFIKNSTDQLNGCYCIVTDISDLSVEKLSALNDKHAPDMIVIDGRCVSSASICHDFHLKLSTSSPHTQYPRLYLDTSQSRHLVLQYFEEHKVCGMVSYTGDKGQQCSFRGKLVPGSDEPAQSNNNYNVASASKLFTVLACYFALSGKIHEPVKVHPDIELPEYIREKITKGVTAEQLIFHQAGMGNYLMKILEMVKSGVPVPIPVMDEKDLPIPLPIISEKTTLSEHAHTLLEDKLNIDLSKQTYSNTGYYVLGLVIETAINEGKKPSDSDWKSFYKYVDETIFADRMLNTSYIQTAKSIASPELDKLLKGQQLPCTSAGCWYSTSDDLYKMMQWVFQKYDTDQKFKEFIDYYNQCHPLRESKDPNEFMHIGRLDTGANAYVSLNLKTGDIYCIVTNEMNWESSGMQHIVTCERIYDAVAAVAKLKGFEVDSASPAKVDRIDNAHHENVGGSKLVL